MEYMRRGDIQIRIMRYCSIRNVGEYEIWGKTDMGRYEMCYIRDVLIHDIVLRYDIW